MGYSTKVRGSLVHKVLILVFVAVCVSCSSISGEEVARTTQLTESAQSAVPISTPDDSPGILVPLPNFPGRMLGIVSEDQRYVLISDEICLYLEQAPFWEPGDYWYAMEDLPTVAVMLDDNNIERFRRFSRGVVTREYDEEGNEIGIHGFSMDYCFTTELQQGTHTLKVEVTTTSGTKHSLSLEFEFVET
jgi:hypothetical protein